MHTSWSRFWTKNQGTLTITTKILGFQITGYTFCHFNNKLKFETGLRYPGETSACVKKIGVHHDKLCNTKVNSTLYNLNHPGLVE